PVVPSSWASAAASSARAVGWSPPAAFLAERGGERVLRHRPGLLLTGPGWRGVAEEAQLGRADGAEAEGPPGRDAQDRSRADVGSLDLGTGGPEPDAALAREEVPDLLDGAVADGRAGAAGGQPDLDQACASRVGHQEVHVGAVRGDRVR